MAEQPRPPAGWYAHPSMAGTQRYWDGNAWTNHIAPSEQAPVPASPRRRDWIRGVIVLGILVGVLGGGSFLLDYNSGAKKAQRACHEYVKNSLKAPTTAEFSGEFAVEGDDEDTWRAHGTVDSENGFGAKVRNDFTCDVSKVGGTFLVKNADFSGNDS